LKTQDPANALLKAYVAILEGSITHGGSPITVGTKIPPEDSEYVHIYIEDLTPMNTGDAVIFNAVVALQVVSMQDTDEGSEKVVNDMVEQIIPLLDNQDAFVMEGFKNVYSMFMGSELVPELTDTNYIITRKLRMSNIIEQL